VELKSQIEASENSLVTAEETLKVLQLTISELENTKEQLMQENVEFQKQLEEMSKPEKSTPTTQENVPEAFSVEKMPEKVVETPAPPSEPSQPSSGGNTAFGFKLPDGATTNGIQVSGQAQVGNGSGNYSGIELQ
jgi:FtsZ-binding cell division protein ZapB